MAHGLLTSSLGISELLDRYMKAKKDGDEALAQQYLAELSNVTGVSLPKEEAFGITPPAQENETRLSSAAPLSQAEQTDIQPPPFQLPPPSLKFALTGGQTPGPLTGSLTGQTSLSDETQGDISEPSQPPIELAALTPRISSGGRVGTKRTPPFSPLSPPTKMPNLRSLPSMPPDDTSQMGQAGISTKGKFLLGGLGLAAILAGALGGGAYGAASVAGGIAQGAEEALDERKQRKLMENKYKQEKNKLALGVIENLHNFLKGDNPDPLSASAYLTTVTAQEPGLFTDLDLKIMGGQITTAIARAQKNEADKAEKSALETTRTKQEIEQRAWSMSAELGAKVALENARIRYKDDPEGLQKYLTDILEPQYRDAKEWDDLRRRGKEADIKRKEQEKPEKGKATQAESINIYNHLIGETTKEIEDLANEVVQKVPDAAKKKADAELKLQGLKNSRDLMMRSFNIGGLGQEETITQAQFDAAVDNYLAKRAYLSRDAAEAEIRKRTSKLGIQIVR